MSQNVLNYSKRMALKFVLNHASIFLFFNLNFSLRPPSLQISSALRAVLWGLYMSNFQNLNIF